MPRKPTLIARQARAGLLALVERLPNGEPLPILGKLGTTFQLHPSTIFRLLHDLAAEGLIWQSPRGKFYAASSRRNTLRGAPICFIGREMWQWSRLYQEILDGVSEVCAANGSPLILLSSRSLVRQDVAHAPPAFALPKNQTSELTSLATALPKGTAGFLFDHLWSKRALSTIKWPGGKRIQLLHGTGHHADVVAPDYQAAAEMAADFARQHAIQKIVLVSPFHGDPAIDFAVEMLRHSLKSLTFTELSYHELARHRAQIQKLVGKHALIICPEDNVAAALAEILADMPAAGCPLLLGTQGTGVLHAPHARLRIDYRRLGRVAASAILHGGERPMPRPSLVYSPQNRAKRAEH